MMKFIISVIIFFDVCKLTNQNGAYGWNLENTQDFIENEGELIKMPIPLGSEEEELPDNSSRSPLIKGYYWCVNTGDIPVQAVKAGFDKDGGDIFIGRAVHEGQIQPAKIIPNHGCAYISYEGEEIRKDDYEILCRGTCSVIWQECQGGVVPYNAVVGGRTTENEKLYIGRVFHDGTHTPGKIQPSHNVCYIPYDGEELSFTDYEVLILQ